MKIAILGTKGIPNNYGGYEQFAEFISTKLVKRGHQVTVYNPSFHAYKGDKFEGVTICRIFSPEKLIGGSANIIYDHLCLRDALKKDFDVIYEAGYHSVALSLKFYNVKKRNRPLVITNMDGLEWRRTKWSKSVQSIIRRLEWIAVQESPYLISDNTGIQSYLKETFDKDSFYLPYGADPVDQFDVEFLREFSVKPREYYMLVARLEPENNIETVLSGHHLAQSNLPFLVVGNNQTEYGQYLKRTYEDGSTRFVGGIYSKPKLDALRFYAKAYFHGHSVGGTNPSLLEAMASQSFIWAHKNPFNHAILGSEAFYFSDKQDVVNLINNSDQLLKLHSKFFVKANFEKIKELYNWDKIVLDHEKLFYTLLEKANQ